ncbi:MAG: AzlC family ABC transporter permease [Anaerolineae bacterium]|nr:AzlC family ABC transporter permease [Anaerolineae bacterium]
MTQANIDTSSLITPSPFSEFLAGARDSFPLIVGAIPFGIIFGTLALSSGLSFTGAMAMSALVFAGSAQFIALGLVAAGTAWPIIVLTTFVVNLRHILYSATLAPYVRHLPRRWQVPLAFWLTDETFLVVVKRYTQQPLSSHHRWYYLGSALFMYTNWQLCTFLGLTVGQMLPNAAAWGLDFAMPVTFLGMVIPYLKNRPMIAAVVVAGVVALVAHPVPHQLGLMIATLAGIATGMLVEQWGKTEAFYE